MLEIHREMLRGILGEYRALADSGQVELTTTPFYHPILPLLVFNRITSASCSEAAAR